MAGTLMFDISPVHTYQRKFTSEALEEALRFSHIYIISRRPPVRIFESYEHRGSARFAFRAPIRSDLVEFRHEFAYEDTRIRDVKRYEAGQYFSFVAGDQLLHGESWALLSLATNANIDIASHEVLYIGMSYGDGGERNVTHRLRNHATLQMIYEQHANIGWDIFVTPVEIDGHASLSNDHIQDSDEGYDLDAYLKHFARPSKIALRRTELSLVEVKLVEHILISAFKPFYNTNLLNWSVLKPTREMEIARDMGLRLLTVGFHGSNGLTRFISAEHPMPERSHFFRAGLTDHPLPNPETYDPYNAFDLMNNFHLRMADSIRESDHMPAILSVFGPEAPEIRRPPGVHLS